MLPHRRHLFDVSTFTTVIVVSFRFLLSARSWNGTVRLPRFRLGTEFCFKLTFSIPTVEYRLGMVEWLEEGPASSSSRRRRGGVSTLELTMLKFDGASDLPFIDLERGPFNFSIKHLNCIS